MSRYEYSSLTGRYEQVDPPSPPRTGRIDFHRLPLDRQGYTRHGQYYGVGAPLYEWYDEDTGKNHVVRAYSRTEARQKFLEIRAKADGVRSNPISSNAVLVGGVAALAVVGIIVFIVAQNKSNQLQAAATAASQQGVPIA